MPLLDRLINLVAPTQCLSCGTEGALLCTFCAQACCPALPEQCFKCGNPSLGSAVCAGCSQHCPLRHVWSRTTYQGAAKQLIHDYKFARAQFAAPTIAAFMAEALPYLPRNTCVVPIPTATSRHRARGYDHAHLLAKVLAKQTGLQFCPLLTRLGQTRQVGANRADRHTQLQGAFRVVGVNQGKFTSPHFTKRPILATALPSLVAAQPPILLVDDVTTTGASLEAAATVLQAAGFKIINAITFAYTPS